MIPPSYLAAILAAAVYVIGFIVIHRYTEAKWFALEVLFGGAVAVAGLGLGGALVPHFRFEYFLSLYGLLWFCFFFVSGIFYASVSLALVRYLSKRTGSSATVDEVYRDCIVVPFHERAQFLTRVGQAKVTVQGNAPDAIESYSITATGLKNAARILQIQRIFGFGTSGYYSVPKDGAPQGVPAETASHPFLELVVSLIAAWSIAESCVAHGLRESLRPAWVSITTVLVITVLAVFGVRSAIKNLFNRAAQNPATWVLWMPIATVLLLAQLAGIRHPGTKTIPSDWVVLAATTLVVVRGLWRTPIRALWPLLVVWILGVLIWFQVGGTGMIHNELVDRYLPSYLTKRPWLDILFDPVIEFDDNRSRPLSLIVDFIDYRLVQASAHLGFPHFRMLTYPAFMLACTGTVYWFCVQDLRLRRSLALTLVMLFQSTPAILFHTLYRSAKLGAALMVIVVFTMLYRFITAAEAGHAARTRWRYLATIWLACMLLPMFDELGTYSISMGVASLTVYALARRTRTSWALWGTVTSTLAGAYFYRYAVSANLYTWINHAKLKSPYNVNRSLFDKMQLESLLKTGIDLSLDTFRFEFGNMSRGVVVAIAVVLLVMYSWGFRLRLSNAANARPYPFVAGLVLLGILAMVLVQFSIMVHYHPPIGSYADVRRVYYSLPTLALFLMIVAVGLKTFCAGHRNVSRVVALVLGLCVVGNVDAAPDHHKVIHTGHLAEFFRLSDETVQKLVNARRGEIPDPLVQRVWGE